MRKFFRIVGWLFFPVIMLFTLRKEPGDVGSAPWWKILLYVGFGLVLIYPIGWILVGPVYLIKWMGSA